MLGPVMSRIDCFDGIEIEIVGNKAVVGAGELGLLDDGVAAFENFKQRVSFARV